MMNLDNGTRYLFKHKATPVAVFLIIALGFIIYANSLNGEFIWDDQYLVRDNIYIRDWSYVPEIFTRDIGAGADKPFNYYRPFHIFTYLIDFSVWELNAFGYHLSNIIFHILTALSVYWFTTVLFKNKTLSLLTGLFFLTHPIQTEAVSSISVRGDALSALFMLVCFILYIKLLDRDSVINYILMLLVYILALLSKENSLILPALIVLYHLIFAKKVEIIKLSSIAAVAGGYAILRFAVLRPVGSHALSLTALFQRIPGFFAAITNYIRLLISPFGLHAEYGNMLFNFTDLKAIAGIIIVAASLLYAFKIRKNNTLASFSICWFFIALLPVSNLYPLAFYMAEHWLYFPSIGFFLLLAAGFDNLLKDKSFAFVTKAFIIGALLSYSYLTIVQNNYWQEPLSFYQRTLKYIPDSPRINNNLGNLYNDMGRHEEAIVLFKRAIKNNPIYVKAYNNLGKAYYNIGDKEKAMKSFIKALKIDPGYSKAYYNLGIIDEELGMKDDAIKLLKKAIELDPGYAPAYNKLGLIYRESGKYRQAAALFKKSIEINPYYAEAYNNLEITYAGMGKMRKQ